MRNCASITVVFVRKSGFHRSETTQDGSNPNGCSSSCVISFIHARFPCTAVLFVRRTKKNKNCILSCLTTAPVERFYLWPTYVLVERNALLQRFAGILCWWTERSSSYDVRLNINFERRSKLASNLLRIGNRTFPLAHRSTILHCSLFFFVCPQMYVLQCFATSLQRLAITFR